LLTTGAARQIGRGHGLGRLKSLQAWSVRTCNVNQWMQIDTGEVQSISGVVTQGRRDAAQWVTSVRVQVDRCGGIST
jgi:ABC-type sugar transport system ATPase subunit